MDGPCLHEWDAHFNAVSDESKRSVRISYYCTQFPNIKDMH